MDPPPEMPGPSTESAESAEEASLRKIAHEGIEYLRHLTQLFLGEVKIARGSFVRMLAAGAFIPVLLLTIWATLNVLLAALVARGLGDPIYGYLAILLVNGVLVAFLLASLRRWKRDLTLPRSRDALARLLERIR
ncbi:MAG: hypothetical protein ABJB01_05720 [Rudaea sp.]